MLKTIGVLWLSICIFLFCAPSGVDAITLQKEDELSREFMKLVRQHYEFVEDELLVNYIDQLGNKILAVMGQQPINYQFFIIKDHRYNAFAGPGGKIFINSGLFSDLTSEDALMGILTHEVSHVKCRHLSDRIDRSAKISMVTLAGMVAGVLLGAGGSPQAAQAVMMGSSAASQSLNLAYSREDERQADQLGLDYLVQSGYSAQGLLDALQKIRSRQWFGQDVIPTYLTTHPAVEDRLSYIDSWMERRGMAETVLKAGPDFKMAQIRLRALYGDPQRTLRQLSEQVQNAPANSDLIYGYALALEGAGRLDEAKTQLKAALNKNAFNPYVLYDLGRLYLNEGNFERALSLMETTPARPPFNPGRDLMLARAQLALGRIQEAIGGLERLITQRPDYARGFYHLGEAYSRAQRPADAHFCLGIHYLLGANTRNARFHLQRAIKLGLAADREQEARKKIKKLKKGKRKEPAEEEKNPRKKPTDRRG